jgi:murein DD-endopeptidase MepM/ murein hydrolase activator NlpD
VNISIYWIGILLLISNFSFANIIVQHNPIAGGIAIVPFTTKSKNPQGLFQRKKVLLQQKNNQWEALIGIPLKAPVGQYFLEIQGLSTQRIPFDVATQTYKKQYITLKGKKKKYVNPPNRDWDRIKKERDIINKALQTFSNTNPSGVFNYPVTGIISSPFGLQRFFNNQPRRPHSGLDFGAKKGSPIIAPMAGKVILIGHYFFNGKTVLLDHGQGLLSIYIHMDKINVKNNQQIKQGDVLGLVGQTGRATGPHLHFGVYLTNTAINPQLLLSDDE